MTCCFLILAIALQHMVAANAAPLCDEDSLLVSGASVEASNGCYHRVEFSSEKDFGVSPRYALNEKYVIYPYDGVWRLVELNVTTGDPIAALYIAAGPSVTVPNACWLIDYAHGVTFPTPIVKNMSNPNEPATCPCSPPSTYPSMHITFEDDFNGTQVNTTKWNVLDQIHRGGVFVEDHAFIENGSLVLFTFPRNMTFGNNQYYIASGAVNTSHKFEQRYGRFETRVILPKVEETSCCMGDTYNYTLHAGIWLTSAGADIGNGCYQEIDLMEQYHTHADVNLLGPETFTSSLHPHVFQPPPGSNSCDGWLVNQTSKTFGKNYGTFSEEFHTFRLDWRPDSIAMYLDDKIVASSLDCASIQAFRDTEYFTLTSTVMNRVPVRPGNVFPQRFVIDYVRIWQYDDLM